MIAHKQKKDYKLGEDEDFPTNRAVRENLETVDERINRLEGEMVKARQEQEIQFVEKINRNGQQRFKDFAKVVGAFSNEINASPDGGRAIYDRIYRSKDPAKFAYRLAGGELPDTSGEKKITEVEKKEKADAFAKNADKPVTLYGPEHCGAAD